MATPRFDFAAVTYLHKLGFDLGRRLPELFPRRELSVARTMVRRSIAYLRDQAAIRTVPGRGSYVANRDS